MAEAIALQRQLRTVFEQPERHGLCQRAGFTDRADAHRAAGLAIATGNERARLRQQLLLHAPQRSAEADAAGISVVDENARRRLRRNRPSFRPACSTDRPTSRASHINRSCATCFMANASPTTPSRRSSAAYGSAFITDNGISNQSDVVCICLLRAGPACPSRRFHWCGTRSSEADHARHHVHFAVQRHVRRVRGKPIENRDLRVGDGGGVVVAVHFLDVRLAADESSSSTWKCGPPPCRWPWDAASTARS